MPTDTTPIVLTPAQRKFLKEASEPGGARAVDSYAPVVRLKELGLIRAVGSMVNWNRTWAATEEGAERVKKFRKTRKRTTKKRSAVKHA